MAYVNTDRYRQSAGLPLIGDNRRPYSAGASTWDGGRQQSSKSVRFQPPASSTGTRSRYDDSFVGDPQLYPSSTQNQVGKTLGSLRCEDITMFQRAGSISLTFFSKHAGQICECDALKLLAIWVIYQ